MCGGVLLVVALLVGTGVSLCGGHSEVLQLRELQLYWKSLYVPQQWQARVGWLARSLTLVLLSVTFGVCAGALVCMHGAMAMAAIVGWVALAMAVAQGLLAPAAVLNAACVLGVAGSSVATVARLRSGTVARNGLVKRPISMASVLAQAI